MTNYELIDITNQIIPEEEIRFFNDEESLEIYDTCIHMMHEFIKENPRVIAEPEFNEIFHENISELMHSHFDYDVFYTEEAQEEMEEIIEHAKRDFFKDYIPPRSYYKSLILKEPNIEYVSNQLQYLRNKPQPAQRTKEWYELRNNLITASNAYKVFESQAAQNQLIYEKCQNNIANNIEEIDILDDDEDNDNIKRVIIGNDDSSINKMVNINTTLHWGQKYEPLSVMYYEYIYNTKIEDFGCIQHDTYSFLGASPDGINVDINKKRYGRMLEIKNIINREINGIPKKEYWIQMQMQMEVCNLDECDFLETKFIEYSDENAYREDTLIINAPNTEIADDDNFYVIDYTKSKNDSMKGIIVYFHTKEGVPHYVYKPLQLSDQNAIVEWQRDTLKKYHSEPYNYQFIKYIYWKLEEVSCVLVKRNKQWFNDNVQEFVNIWKIIEKERKEGFNHRAPVRKNKKEITDTNIPAKPSVCLLQFNKDTKVVTINKQT